MRNYDLKTNPIFEAMLMYHFHEFMCDILNNIELTDKLCARVSEETYKFIKLWKEETKNDIQTTR